MARFDQNVGYRADEAGAMQADINAALAGQIVETAQITATTVDVPVVDGTFSPIFTRGKKGRIFVTLRFANFGTARDIKVVMLPRAQVLTSDDYDNLTIQAHLTEEISDEAIAVQLVTSPLDEPLDPSTQYDVIRLVAIGANNDERAVNPTPDPVYADYPGNVLYTFTTPEAFGVPSSPSASLITINRLDPVTQDVYDVEIERIVYAPLTDAGAAQTWAAARVDQVDAVLWLDSELIDPGAHILTDTELTQIADGVSGRPLSSPANRGFVRIRNEGLTPGRTYTWAKNVAWAAGDKAVSTGAAVNFVAGNLQTDPTQLTSLSLTVSDTDPYSGKWRRIALNLTQPATVVALKKCAVDRKVQGALDSTYVRVIESFGLRSDEWHTAGAKTIPLADNIKLKAGTAYTLRCIITAVGGSQTSFTQNIASGTGEEVEKDTAAPGNLPTPTLKYKRGALLAKLDMSVVTSINTLKKIELCVTDGVSKSLNIGDLDSDTAAAVNTFYEIGLDAKFPIPISRDQIRTIFGSGNSIYCTYKLTNDYLGGSTTTSANSTAKSTDTLEDYSSRGAPGGGNELWNGDFVFDNGTSTDLGNWQQFNINDTTASAWSTITTTSVKTRWTPASQLVFFRENDAAGGKRYIVQNLFRTIIRNDYHSFTWFLSANSSLSAASDLFLAALFNLTGTVQTNGTNIVTGTGTSFTTELKVGAEVSINGLPYTVSQIDTTTQFRTTTTVPSAGPGLTVRAAVPQSDIISIPSRSYGTTDTYFEATVQVNSDAFTDKDIYLCFRTSTTITTAGPFLQIRRVMMSPGQTPIMFDRKYLRERNTDSDGLSAGSPVASENFSTVPTSTIGGQYQDASGEVPGKGNYQIPV